MKLRILAIALTASAALVAASSSRATAAETRVAPAVLIQDHGSAPAQWNAESQGGAAKVQTVGWRAARRAYYAPYYYGGPAYAAPYYGGYYGGYYGPYRTYYRRPYYGWW